MQIVTSYNNVYVISVNTYKGSQNDNIFLKYKILIILKLSMQVAPSNTSENRAKKIQWELYILHIGTMDIRMPEKYCNLPFSLLPFIQWQIINEEEFTLVTGLTVRRVWQWSRFVQYQQHVE